MRSNKPLYFTKQYALTYDDSDVPTHYAFKVSANLDGIAREYERLRKASPTELETLRQSAARKSNGSAPADRQVRAVIDSLDERGAWVEEGRLRYHGDSDDTRRVIQTTTFVRNINLLSRYLGAAKSGT